MVKVGRHSNADTRQTDVSTAVAIHELVVSLLKTAAPVGHFFFKFNRFKVHCHLLEICHLDLEKFVKEVSIVVACSDSLKSFMKFDNPCHM